MSASKLNPSAMARYPPNGQCSLSRRWPGEYSSGAMTTETISLEVDADVARAFCASPAKERRKLELLLNLRRRELIFVPEGGEVGVAGAEFGELGAVCGVLDGLGGRSAAFHDRSSGGQIFGARAVGDFIERFDDGGRFGGGHQIEVPIDVRCFRQRRGEQRIGLRRLSHLESHGLK